MTTCINDFTHAGDELERRWRCHSYDLAIFPMLAEEAAASLSAPDMVELLETQYTKLNKGHRFSDFDIYIYQNEKFHIELLHWLNVSTSIHQHRFCGVFKMMRGRSLNIESTFEVERQHSEDFLSGRLAYKRSKVLRKGDICRIDGGASFIHANYHLGRPVMTMVIRTNGNQNFGPQYEYWPPHFASNPFPELHSRVARGRMLDVVAQIGQSGAFEQVVRRLLAQSTLEEALEVVLHYRILHGDRARLERVLDMAGDRHPEYRDQMVATAFEVHRSAEASALRRKVDDIDQKFLLALLANLTDRGPILAHLEQEFPGEPPSTAAARLLQGIAEGGHLPLFSRDDIPVCADVIAGVRSSAHCGLSRALLDHEILQPLFVGGDSALIAHKRHLAA